MLQVGKLELIIKCFSEAKEEESLNVHRVLVLGLDERLRLQVEIRKDVLQAAWHLWLRGILPRTGDLVDHL